MVEMKDLALKGRPYAKVSIKINSTEEPYNHNKFYSS
jgi:hypothetical protein